MSKNIDDWKSERTSTDLAVMGGEIVFKDSRLSVRHIGALAERESIAAILEDYPYLNAEDVTFAKQFSKEESP